MTFPSVLRVRGPILAAAATLAAAAGLPAAGAAARTAILDTGDGTILGVAFAPDGRTVAAVSVTRAARQDDPGSSRLTLWNAATGALLAQSGPTPFEFLSVAFSPDGRTIATGRPGGEVTLWDAATLREQATLRAGLGAVTAVAFLPDGLRLAGAASREGVVVWDVASRAKIAPTGTGRPAAALAVSPAGDLIAAAGADGAVHLLDAEGRLVATLAGFERDAAAPVFSPDGRHVAALGRTRPGAAPSVLVWTAHGAEVAARIENGPEDGTAAVLAFAPGGTLAVGGTTGVRLVDAATGTVLKRWMGRTPPVVAAHFSPAGSVLATGDAGGAVRLWDVALREAPGAAGLSATTEVAPASPAPRPSPRP